MNPPTRYIFRTIIVNLLVALMIFYVLVDCKWKEVGEFLVFAGAHLAVAIATLFITGKLIGDNLHRFKSPHKRFSVLHGVVTLFIVLVCSLLAGGMVGFLKDGLGTYQSGYSLGESMFDYIVKPAYWILLFGAPPTLISGLVLGIALRKLPTDKQ